MSHTSVEVTTPFVKKISLVEQVFGVDFSDDDDTPIVPKRPLERQEEEKILKDNTEREEKRLREN